MALSGAEVVRKHKEVISACSGKTSWDLLECIVDGMHNKYKG